MVRHAYIHKKVLELYHAAPAIHAPIRPDGFLPYLPKESKILTYKEMAAISGCTALDVNKMCSSMTGATHYDSKRNRCLILYNDEMPAGRALWTQCHEIGHICLGHLDLMENGDAAHEGSGMSYEQFEQEADCFAWNLIAPLPVLRDVGVTGPYDICRRFGMSGKASTLHWERYMRWERGHIKTAFDTQIVREYRKKLQVDVEEWPEELGGPDENVEIQRLG